MEEFNVPGEKVAFTQGRRCPPRTSEESAKPAARTRRHKLLLTFGVKTDVSLATSA